MTELEQLIIDYGEHTRWAGYYSEGDLANKKNADAIETLAKIKLALDAPVAPAVDAQPVACYQCKGCGDSEYGPWHCVRCSGTGKEPANGSHHG